MSADRAMIQAVARDHRRVWAHHRVHYKLSGGMTDDDGPSVFLGAKCFGVSEGEPCPVDWQMYIDPAPVLAPPGETT